MVQGDAVEERDASDQTVGGEAAHPGPGPGLLAVMEIRRRGESALAHAIHPRSKQSPGCLEAASTPSLDAGKTGSEILCNHTLCRPSTPSLASSTLGSRESQEPCRPPSSTPPGFASYIGRGLAPDPSTHGSMIDPLKQENDPGSRTTPHCAVSLARCICSPRSAF